MGNPIANALHRSDHFSVARCCPFFTFEQVEQADGVLLRVSRAAAEGA